MASKSRIAKLNFSWAGKISKRSSFVGAIVIADYADDGYRTLVLERPQVKSNESTVLGANTSDGAIGPRVTD